MYEIIIDGQSSRKTVTQSYRTCKMVASCKKKDVHCLFDMDGFLSKPIVIKDLIDALQHNLERV